MAGNQKKFQSAVTYARRFSEQGQWSEAVKAYRFALAEFPNDLEAIIGFGQANLQLGQVALAQKALEQALRLDPSNHQALTYMATTLEQQQQLDAAAETYLRLGNIFASEDDWEAALEAWQQTLRLVPDHVQAHGNVGRGLIQQEQPRQAARQFLILAAIYQERNNREQVIRQIENAQEVLGDEPSIAAAYEALEQGLPIDPDKALEPPPQEEVVEPEELYHSIDFTQPLPPLEDDFFAEEEEEDPFAIDEADLKRIPTGGLVELAQQNALAELADAIFEEAGAGPHSGTMSRDEANMLIIQAIDLQSSGDLDQAAQIYRQVVQAGAGRPALYFNLGLLYKEQENYADAPKMLKMAAQVEKYKIPAEYALGMTYYQARNLDAAISHLVEVVRLVDLKTIGGYKAEELQEYYEALPAEFTGPQATEAKTKNFVQALEQFFTNPNWEKRVYQARQRMESIAEDGTNIMSLAEFLETPETEVVITTLAVTNEYMKRNLLMTAAEESLRAIQKAPFYLPLHARLAEILLKQNYTEEAITKYLYIAKVYQMRNQFDQAINIFVKILRLAPMDVTVRSKLIDLYISRNNLEQAVEQYLMLADSYYQLAQVDRALEKYNEALRLAAKLEDSATWEIEILSHIGDIYNQRFDWARATRAFERMLEVNPSDEQTQRRLIDLYFKQRKAEPAIALLDKLLPMYQKQNRSGAAVELLRDLTINYPDNIELRERLARAYAQHNMRKEAIAEYDAVGEMQLERGLRNQAMKTIQAILDLGPDDVEGYRRLLSKISGGAA